MFYKYDGKADLKPHLWQFDSYLYIRPNHKNQVANLFNSTLTMIAAMW